VFRELADMAAAPWDSERLVEQHYAVGETGPDDPDIPVSVHSIAAEPLRRNLVKPAETGRTTTQSAIPVIGVSLPSIFRRGKKKKKEAEAAAAGPPAATFKAQRLGVGGLGATVVTVAPKNADHPWRDKGPNKNAYVVRTDTMIAGRQGIWMVMDAGKEYIFELNDVPPDHPFFFTTTSVGGPRKILGPEGLQVDLSEPTQGGVLSFRPDGSRGRFFYQCSHHPYMGGPVTVIGHGTNVLGAFAQTNRLLTANASRTEFVVIDMETGDDTRHRTLAAALDAEGAAAFKDHVAGTKLCDFNSSVAPDVDGISLNAVGILPEGTNFETLSDDQAVHVCRYGMPMCTHISTLRDALDYLQNTKEPDSSIMCHQCG